MGVSPDETFDGINGWLTIFSLFMSANLLQLRLAE
jgi:hypothetical protein